MGCDTHETNARKTDAEVLAPWQSYGDPPPPGGMGPLCPGCGFSRWIELGGGPAIDVYHPNLDSRFLPGVDIVFDLEDGPLPFHDDHADRIKMIHVLNHLSAVKGEALLRDCLRVLQPGGSLYIMVTVVQFALTRIFADGWRDCWTSMIWGTRGDTYHDDFHKWGFSPESLGKLLLTCGFREVRERGRFNYWDYQVEAFK